MRKFMYLIPVLLLTLACTNTRVPVEDSPDHISSNPGGKGIPLEISMVRGEGHNHPLMAIWVEDDQGNYLQTLYVAESIGKGIFRHGDASRGFWKPGEIQRPAALPRWAHQRGILSETGLYIPSPRNPVPDAYTGPTPSGSFVLHTHLDEPGIRKFRVLFEINQTWDWNEFWTNNKYPDDEEYKTSCQPALVYQTLIDLDDPKEEYVMEVLGRSHHSGATGELFSDLETLTTAMHIADHIVVRIPSD
jgi:hypothetical protein